MDSSSFINTSLDLHKLIIAIITYSDTLLYLESIIITIIPVNSLSSQEIKLKMEIITIIITTTMTTITIIIRVVIKVMIMVKELVIKFQWIMIMVYFR